MRIAPLFLTLLKRYFGLKHLLTLFSVMLDSLIVVEVLSGSISGLRRLPSLSVIIGLSLSYLALLVQRKYITNNVHVCACLSVLFACNIIKTMKFPKLLVVHTCLSHISIIFLSCSIHVSLKCTATKLLVLNKSGDFWNTARCASEVLCVP